MNFIEIVTEMDVLLLHFAINDKRTNILGREKEKIHEKPNARSSNTQLF